MAMLNEKEHSFELIEVIFLCVFCSISICCHWLIICADQEIYFGEENET